MKKDRTEIIPYINTLKDYEGYIQFSDTKIRDCDIFQKSDVIATKLQVTNGFVYEAHFCNGIESIAIKQINDDWLVSKTDISQQLEAKKQDKEYPDVQIYHAINGLQVKMAQIWESENDPLCKKNMPVLKLKKVVFAGFEGGNQ